MKKKNILKNFNIEYLIHLFFSFKAFLGSHKMDLSDSRPLGVSKGNM